MNAAIATTGTRTWKLVKAHYLAAALGAALTLSAVAGVDNVKNIDFGGSTSSQAPASSVAATHTTTQTRNVFYMVSSEAAAQDFYRAQGATLLSGQLPSFVAIPVVVTSDEQAQQMQMGYFYAGQAAGSQTAFEVVDLRGR